MCAGSKRKLKWKLKYSRNCLGISFCWASPCINLIFYYENFKVTRNIFWYLYVIHRVLFFSRTHSIKIFCIHRLREEFRDELKFTLISDSVGISYSSLKLGFLKSTSGFLKLDEFEISDSILILKVYNVFLSSSSICKKKEKYTFHTIKLPM